MAAQSRSSGKIHFLILLDGNGLHPGGPCRGGVRDDASNSGGPSFAGNPIIVWSSVVARADKAAPCGYEIERQSCRPPSGESHDYPITRRHGVDYCSIAGHLWILSRAPSGDPAAFGTDHNAVRDFFTTRIHPVRQRRLHPRCVRGHDRRSFRRSTSTTDAYMTQNCQLLTRAERHGARPRVSARGRKVSAPRNQDRRP